MKVKPSVVVNASGMSYYGTSETDTFDETARTVIRTSWQPLWRRWERAADQIHGTRVVKVRVGLVLDNLEGAFPKMAMPYKLGVGGTVGSGKQWLSWIHIADMVRLIDFCVHHPSIHGPVNATAPHPVRNKEFGRTLASTLRRPNMFPVPALMMKLIFGELSVCYWKVRKCCPRSYSSMVSSGSFPILKTHCLIWQKNNFQIN